MRVEPRILKKQKLGGLLVLLAGAWLLHGCGSSSVGPTITNFSASSSSVPRGGTVQLTWTVRDAQILMVEPIGQNVTAAASLTVTVNDNTTYTLRAHNNNGDSTSSVTVATTDPGDRGIRPTLVYTDPPAGGKIRLVKDASSTDNTVVLKLVSNASLTAYSVGFNLPLSTSKVEKGDPFFTPSTEALNPGADPKAFAAALPSATLDDGTATHGPLVSVLVTGLSQKAAGAGAVPNDAQIASGKLFYTIKLNMAQNPVRGVVFDGAHPAPKFRAELRNKVGGVVATQSDFAIGKLEVR